MESDTEMSHTTAIVIFVILKQSTIVEALAVCRDSGVQTCKIPYRLDEMKRYLMGCLTAM